MKKEKQDRKDQAEKIQNEELKKKEEQLKLDE